MAQSEHGSLGREVRVSAIIPAHNAAETIGVCLDSLDSLTRKPDEVIVVCDGCTDATASIAEGRNAKVVRSEARRGAAHARNVGVLEATGDVFFFIDSDCVARPPALETGLRAIEGGEEIVFGSYARDTRVEGFLTRFKNLQHHETHQRGQDYQSTFWSGCGIVTRRAFEGTGGFDSALKSCEDIEFGAEAERQGYRIRLVRDMQVEHLKRYDLGGLVRSDLFQRAVPWTQLIRAGRAGMGALNTNRLGQGSVAATAVLLAALPASLWWPQAAGIALLAMAALIAANYRLLSLVSARLGLLAGLAAVPTLVMHYFICGFGFVLGHLAPPTPKSREDLASTRRIERGTSEALRAKVSS